MPLSPVSLTQFIQSVGRASRLHPIDRVKIYSGEIDPSELHKMIKPYAYIIVPEYGEFGQDIRDNIKQMIDQLRDYGFNPKEDVIIKELHGSNIPKPLDTINVLDTRARRFGTFVGEIVHELESEEQANKFHLQQEKETNDWYQTLLDHDKLYDTNFNEWIDCGVKLLLDETIDVNTKEHTIKHWYDSHHLKGASTIYTPPKLREKMIAKSVKPNDKILVLFNLEFVKDLYKNKGEVIFISDDKIRNEIVERAFKVKTFLVENNNYKEILKDMKFDLIISNPPYNKNLDLKILKDVYELGERICFVHPVAWLYDNKLKDSSYTKTRELLKSDLVDITILRSDLYFDILVNNLAITYFNKLNQNEKIYIENDITNNKYNVNSIYDIDRNCNFEEYKTFKQKILSYCKAENMLTKVIRTDNVKSWNRPNQPFEIGLPLIRGGDFNTMRQFFTFIQEVEEDRHIGESTEYKLKYFFDTKEEAINFKEYLKSKITRACLSIFKANISLHGGLGSVPYLPTYTHPWSDEEIAKELGLTKEEVEWAYKNIQNYYQEDYAKSK